MTASLESIAGARNVPIPERKTYIPHWYKPHDGPGLIPVSHRGTPMGFTVADVLPERRWALAEDGSTLPQEHFEKSFKKWWSGYGCGDDPNFAPIPKVECFVNKTIDNEGKYIDIGFDPYKPGASPIEAKWTRDGELWQEKLEREAAQNTEMRSLVAKQEKLSMLTEMLNRGEITPEVYATKLGDLMGTEAPKIISTAKPVSADRRKAPDKVASACGKLMDPRGIRWHEGRCTKCKEAKLDHAEATSTGAAQA